MGSKYNVDFFSRFMDIYFNNIEVKKAIEDISNNAVFDAVIAEEPVQVAPVVSAAPSGTNSFSLRRYTDLIDEHYCWTSWSCLQSEP
jgi:hypothetical protein